MQTECDYHTVDVDEAVTLSDFLSDLWRRGRYYDLFPIFGVPLALVLIHIWLGDARLSYAFEYANPSLRNAYVANFVHFDTQHLLVNLLTYLLIVPLSYVFSLLTNRRRHASVIFLIILFGFPAALMVAQLPLKTTGRTVGFSGVLMGFYGYASLIFFGYTVDRLTNAVHLDHAPALLSIQASVITVFLIPASPIRNVILVAFLSLTAVLLLSAVYQLDSDTSLVHKAYATSGGYLETTVLGACIVGAILVLGFADTISGEQIVNHEIHLIGFITGFLVSFIILRLDCSMNHVHSCATEYSECTIHDTKFTRIAKKINTGK